MSTHHHGSCLTKRSRAGGRWPPCHGPGSQDAARTTNSERSAPPASPRRKNVLTHILTRRERGSHERRYGPPAKNLGAMLNTYPTDIVNALFFKSTSGSRTWV